VWALHGLVIVADQLGGPLLDLILGPAPPYPDGASPGGGNPCAGSAGGTGAGAAGGNGDGSAGGLLGGSGGGGGGGGGGGHSLTPPKASRGKRLVLDAVDAAPVGTT